MSLIVFLFSRGLAHKYIILISTSEWDRVFKALLIESHDDVDASPPIDSDSLPRVRTDSGP
jgi:hypothetical protein